jgi:hypothetical protein
MGTIHSTSLAANCSLLAKRYQRHFDFALLGSSIVRLVLQPQHDGRAYFYEINLFLKQTAYGRFFRNCSLSQGA